MTQVNHGKSDKVTTHEKGVAAFKTQQQGAKLVNPGERALTGETAFVDVRVEQAFATTLSSPAIAFVLGHVGNNTVIEANFAGGFGVKGTIGVEESTGKGKAQPLHGFEGGLQMRFQFKGIMMMTSHQWCRRHHKALGIRDRQDVGGLGAFARLIAYRFTAFLGNGVAAIQIEFRKIQFVLDAHNAGLPHFFQATIPAPLAKMVVDRMIADFFFSGSPGLLSMGN